MRAVQLVQVYHKTVVDAEAEDDEEVMMAATLQVTSPLVKLVDACAELPETLDKLQDLLLPVMEDMCRRKNVDAIEPVRRVFACVFCPSALSTRPRLDSPDCVSYAALALHADCAQACVSVGARKPPSRMLWF